MPRRAQRNTEYELRGVLPGGSWSILGRGATSTTMLAWQDAGLDTPVVGTAYQFRVRSRSAEGEIGPLHWVDFTIGDFAPPEMPPPVDWKLLPPEYSQPTNDSVRLSIDLVYDGLGRLADLRHPDLDGGSSAKVSRNVHQVFSYNRLNGTDTVNFKDRPIVTGTTYRNSGLPFAASVVVYESNFGVVRTIYAGRLWDSLGRPKRIRVDDGSHRPTI